MKKLLFIGFIFFISGATLLARNKSKPSVEISPTVKPGVEGKDLDGVFVAKVIDGDTIVLETGETLRYIGIDAPEESKGEECFAIESTNKNRELVGGKLVRLEKDVSETDKYKRLLGYVWLSDLMVNDYLIREGYAKASSYPPNVKYQDRFSKAEREARENNRGLWGICDKILNNITTNTSMYQ